jgi:phosphoribosylanthranilate isomerase
VIIQIYGVTNVEDALLVAGLGVEHVGVVLAEGFDTWDEVDADTARAIRRALAGRTKVVALSLAVEPEAVMRTVEALEPDLVHVVRMAEHSTAALAELRERAAPAPVMTTIPVRGAGSVELARTCAGQSDYLLLDTVDPGSGTVGATGLVHDWATSAAIVDAVDTPVILAGGLGPENVVDAIERTRPSGVDSETRTSRGTDRRRKDPDRLARFVELVRSVG